MVVDHGRSSRPPTTCATAGAKCGGSAGGRSASPAARPGCSRAEERVRARTSGARCDKRLAARRRLPSAAAACGRRRAVPVERLLRQPCRAEWRARSSRAAILLPSTCSTRPPRRSSTSARAPVPSPGAWGTSRASRGIPSAAVGLSAGIRVTSWLCGSGAPWQTASAAAMNEQKRNARPVRGPNYLPRHDAAGACTASRPHHRGATRPERPQLQPLRAAARRRSGRRWSATRLGWCEPAWL